MLNKQPSRTSSTQKKHKTCYVREQWRRRLRQQNWVNPFFICHSARIVFCTRRLNPVARTRAIARSDTAFALVVLGIILFLILLAYECLQCDIVCAFCICFFFFLISLARFVQLAKSLSFTLETKNGNGNGSARHTKAQDQQKFASLILLLRRCVPSSF